ncbi:hypothetical protein DPMN_146244 [Dreissena polymorpha]|uniref:Uncharacterized protein n=1 Tax=Dreissena polymorpha TaxID=45954 RepID=A0A9D4F5J6_DREPO|nr:hypothetical protein DPMN_146244 [Dreissena polymorpha]
MLCIACFHLQSDLHLLPHDVVLPPESLPGFGPVLLLDTVAGKLAVSLDQAFTCTPVCLIMTENYTNVFL